ncbi:hypothetical protein TNCV_4776581 [Trichonephila clavipes]|nr:hypothetical protein TNCV_4776581 [Trichonephila clavipes]
MREIHWHKPARPNAACMVVGLCLDMGNGHHKCPVDIFPNSQLFREYIQKKHLTIEFIRIMILLRLSREQDEAPLCLRPWAQLAHASRRP